MIRKSWYFMRSKSKRYLLVLIFSTSLLSTGLLTVSFGASVPDWLAAATRVELGEFGQGSAAIIVTRQEEFTVDPDGEFVQKEWGAIRVLSHKAAESHVWIAGYENTDQKVVEIKTWVIQRSGDVVKSKKRGCRYPIQSR